MKRTFLSPVLIFSLITGSALPARANVPSPPANQQIGIPDGIYNNLQEADCRFCHQNPDQFPVGPGSIPDRHHLLMNDTVTFGTCSLSGDHCQPNAGIDCPPDSGACFNASAAPFPPPPGGTYNCFSCHDVVCSNSICNINVYRNCPSCHFQYIGETGADATVHHITSTAQSGDCVYCHGDIVDNMDDGHVIPSYAPSPSTPAPGGGDGVPFNSAGVGAGGCEYCHSSGNSGLLNPGTDAETGILVYKNSVAHHYTGLGSSDVRCEWCHNIWEPREYRIRGCEGCHGYESLHNIQADSDGDGVINPGIEMPFYGHIGNPDDCWGCHGYALASEPAPGAGPVIPDISNTDISVITAGYDTALTLSGSAFTNLDNGFEWTSSIVVTASEGSSIELFPDSISQDSMDVTIPKSLSAGNHDLRAVKGDQESNHIVISVIPDVVIMNVECSGKKGVMTITGSGFSEKVEGTDAYINVEINGTKADIVSWTDTRIMVYVSRCSGNDNVTVNSLFGSDVSSSKPPKPCRGKGCNK